MKYIKKTVQYGVLYLWYKITSKGVNINAKKFNFFNYLNVFEKLHIILLFSYY